MRDHSRPKKKSPKGGGGFGRMLWFALGFTFGVGGSAGFVWYLNDVPTPFIAPPTRESDGDLLRRRGDSSGGDVFEFHRILKDRRAPASEGKSDADAPAQFVFYLQAGAFRDEETAESRRGELALLGAPARLNAGKLATGEPLFRVWVGPFADRPSAEEARAELALNGYNASVLKATE